MDSGFRRNDKFEAFGDRLFCQNVTMERKIGNNIDFKEKTLEG